MTEHTHHEHHVTPAGGERREYIKFAAVIAGILALAYAHAAWRGLDLLQFLESFMGVFFVAFASFKLIRLKEFAYGFASYDILAKRSLAYGYAFPFIQFLTGSAYLLAASTSRLDAFVVVLSAVSTLGVYQSLRGNQQFRCVCLGTLIRLPLSKISLVEDAGMGLMALAMLAMR